MAILNKIINSNQQLAITAIIIHMETTMTTTKKAKKTLIRNKDNDRKVCKNGDKNKNGKYKHNCDSDHDFKK